MVRGAPVRAYRQISLEEHAEAIHLVYVRHFTKAAAARYLGVPGATLRQRLRVYERGWARDAAALAHEPPRAPRTVFGAIWASLAPDHPARRVIERGENWIAPEFTIVGEDGSVTLDVDAIFA